MKKIIFSVCALALFVNSCKPDFEVNAPYKESTIVYGLLNSGNEYSVASTPPPAHVVTTASLSPNLIRISKAFLGEGNANDMAKIIDSSNYKPGEVQVNIERYKIAAGAGNKSLDTTFSLTPVDLQIPSDGVHNEFTSTQRFYTWKGLILPSTTNLLYSYKLNVINRSKKLVTAETQSVGTITFKRPTAQDVAIPPISTTGDFATMSFSFGTAINGYSYQMVMRFHYKEKSLSTKDSVEMYFDYTIGSYIMKNEGQPETASHTVKGEDWFRALQAATKVDNSVQRIIGDVDYIYTAIPKELSVFIEVSKPSLSIAQSKPDYTNIQGGRGFFSMKSVSILKGLRFDDNTKKALINSSYTSNLGFKTK